MKSGSSLLMLGLLHPLPFHISISHPLGWETEKLYMSSPNSRPLGREAGEPRRSELNKPGRCLDLTAFSIFPEPSLWYPNFCQKTYARASLANTFKYVVSTEHRVEARLDYARHIRVFITHLLRSFTPFITSQFFPIILIVKILLPI